VFRVSGTAWRIEVPNALLGGRITSTALTEAASGGAISIDDLVAFFESVMPGIGETARGLLEMYADLDPEPADPLICESISAGVGLTAVRGSVASPRETPPMAPGDVDLASGPPMDARASRVDPPGMRRLLGLVVVLAASGCETSLGSRQDVGAHMDAAIAIDARDPRDSTVDAWSADDTATIDRDAVAPGIDASLVNDAPSTRDDDAWVPGPVDAAARLDTPLSDGCACPDSWRPDAPVAPSCPVYGGLWRPGTGPRGREVCVWWRNAWSGLAEGVAAEPRDCAEYWITISPVSGDSTLLRAGEAARMHARGETIHAIAELHWGDWSAYRARTGMSWTEVGHLFRQRMVEAGYCVESGDTWGINEAPTGARLDSPGIRDGLEELTRALYEGTPGMPTARGAVYVINFGQGSSTGSIYKGNLQSWLTDATFWGQMNLHVRFWAQEVYTDPDVTCVPGSTRANRATRINEYTMHPTRLTAAAPAGAGAGTAETYLNRAYTPLMNAVWGSDGLYGHTVVPLDTMQMLISEQVRATRLWADGHLAPDGRIGFAFGSYESPTEWTTLGQRLARAIRGAYGRSATADGACFEGTSNVWCDCSVPGATFTSIWTGFDTW